MEIPKRKEKLFASFERLTPLNKPIPPSNFMCRNVIMFVFFDGELRER